MPNITPIQADFSVGEVSRDLNKRSTLENQRKGVQVLTNFYPDSRGPVVRRKGFRYLGTVGVAAPQAFAAKAIVFDSGGFFIANTFDEIIADPAGTRDNSLTNIASFTTNNVGTTIVIADFNLEITQDFESFTTVSLAGLGFANSNPYLVWLENSNLWALVGKDSSFDYLIQTSPDGETWTTTFNGKVNGFNPLANSIATDGTNIAWVGNTFSTPRFPVFYATNNLQTVTSTAAEVFPTEPTISVEKMWYLNGNWFAGGARNRIYRTSNASPTSGWSRVYEGSTNSNHDIDCMVFGNNEYFALSDTTTDLYASNDGVSWSIKRTLFGNGNQQALSYSELSGGWSYADGTVLRTSNDNWVTIDNGNTNFFALIGTIVASVLP